MASVPDFKDRSGKWVLWYCIPKTRRTLYTRIGQKHADMVKRCTPHSPEQLRHNNYMGCTMSPVFKDPQTFGDWFVQQRGYDEDGWHLDKDILLRGNKVYSEDTCILVPNSLNKFLTKREARRGEYPIGVIWKALNKRFCASMTLQGKSKHLGLFSNPEDAFYKYKEVKESEAKRLAEHWKDKIDPRAYEALMNYTVEITD